ncbi:LysR family transcriptional regulator [soil metagenome]
MKYFDPREPQLSDLRAVLAVVQDGTVTRAAQTLGVTQSALSYTVDRMRKRFGDPLFVRVGNRMAPTPFAERLAEAATRVLRIVETEVAALARFDPSTTTREFRLGVNELGAMTMVPKLVSQLARIAPGARLVPALVDTPRLSQSLERGEIDLAAGYFPSVDGSLFQQLLYRRDYVCVARKNHPTIGASMSLEQFCEIPQVQMNVPTTLSWLDAQLRKQNLRPLVGMSSQHVAAIPFIVAASDMVAIIPRELYELFLPISAIKRVQLPLQIPSLDVHQCWHARLAGDPAIAFLREQLYTATRD